MNKAPVSKLLPATALSLLVAFVNSPTAFADGEAALEELQHYKHEGNAFGSEVISLEVCPKGDCIVSAGPDRTVRVWAAGTAKASEKARAELKADDAVYDTALSPDGATLAVATQNKGVLLWPTRGGKAKPVALIDDQKRRTGARAVAFSPDGAKVAAVDGHRNVFLIDAKAGKVIKHVSMEDGWIDAPRNITFTKTGNNFVVHCRNGVIVLDTKSGELVANTPAPAKPQPAYEFTAGVQRADGTLLLTGLSGHLYEYAKAQWPEPAHMFRNVGKATSMAHATARNVVVVAENDNLKVMAYDDAGDETSDARVVATYAPKRGMTGYRFRSVAVDPKGNFLVGGTYEGDVVVFKMPSAPAGQ